MSPEVWHQAMGTFFGLLQLVLFALAGAGIKLYVDVRQHGRDLDSAFEKIRDIEQSLKCRGESNE